MKWFKWIFSTAVFLLLLGLGAIFFIQSQWAKDKIGTVLEEIALQQGLTLKIEQIDGELPLKWTLSNVHLRINDLSTLDVERIRLRLSILPLLRGHFKISYLSADHGIYQFTPSASSATLPTLPTGFSIRMLKLNEFEAINRTTHEKAVYTLTGNCSFKKRTFDLFAKIHSDGLDFTGFAQGKKGTIEANLDLHVRSEKAFAPFASIPYKAPVHLETTFSLFSDQSLELSSLTVQSDLINLQGKGLFDAHLMPKTLDCRFTLSHLNVRGVAQLKESDFSLVLKSDKLNLRKIEFDDGHLNLQAHQTSEGWKGSFDTAAFHPSLGFHGSSHFAYANKKIVLSNLSFQAPESSITGDVAIDFANKIPLSGGLAFQFNDLKPYSDISALPLAGQIGGQIDFKEGLRCHALAKSCKAGPFISDQVVIDIFATDLFDEIKGKFDLEIEKSYFADIFFTSGRASLFWNSHDWSYSLKTQGEWKNPFDIALEGHFSYQPNSLDFHCDHFSGTLLQKNLHLAQPFAFHVSNEGASLSDFRLNVDGGYIQSSFAATSTRSKIAIQAKHFPVDFLTLLSPRLSLQGLSSIDISLEGSNTDLAGQLNLLLEHADIFPAGTTVPIQTKANFQASLNHDKLQLHSHIIATGEQFVELLATIPLSYQLYPFKLALEKEKNWAAECTVEGHIEQLFDFINIGTQRFGGFLSAKLVSSGTFDKPLLYGPFSIQNGFYQNYIIGLSLKNTQLQGVASGRTLDIEHVDLSDEIQGTASARGQIRLEPTLPLSLEGHIANFRLVHFDWLTAACTGPFKLTGNTTGALAQGTLTIDEAHIQIPDQLPSELPTLPVTFINKPESHILPVQPTTAPPFRYDLQIRGDKNIHLAGHGIDAELIGDLHLTGENLAITTVGSLKVSKGKFSFAGRDFKITQGEVSFTEGDSFINLTSNLDLSDMSVTVTFRGSFKSPQLNFQSNPPLPTSSILARILFNKDVSELNASQAGQLAYAIISLSGGSGPSLLDKIHKNLGIDRLGISTNETIDKKTGQKTEKVAVQIGKYLTEGVMITLNQSTEQSHVIVEVELKGGFVLQAETHFNDQGKYIFKWNKNY
ncbi:MAG TPA: translocation/assembly module TamB domain-containing protein [Rhabdochlamydiaceae bacterium]|nr:translocation/assembly module TamB domain-containing protein [Rhabdochlamydiaceae bacterium]